jgi:class 3 adenylate cyclase
VRAALFTAVTALALFSVDFFPAALSGLLAIATGALALYSAPLASVLFVAVCALPVLAADFVVGVLFLVVGFGATQYLGDHEARGFIAVALAAVAIAVHAEWAVVILAGYLLGPGQGAVAAVVAWLLIEIAGLMLGRPALGTLFVGGTAPGVLSFTNMPTDPLTFGWVSESFAAIDTARVFAALTNTRDLAILGVQAALWGGGAAIAGMLHRPDRTRKIVALGGVSAAVTVLGVATAIALSVTDSSIGFDKIALTGAVSLVVALGITAVTEWYFPLKTQVLRPTHGLQAEDADVDELLSAIATAEAALTSRHTANAVVLITDMKSFSAMTESLGSVESAKLVQRHRDLLLPVIDGHGGAGKSTGGDGLVAAFSEPLQALTAARAMQRSLAGPELGGETVAIRIGIAQGEVVLDKAGRPFIGAALNLAARVMDLADGGRIMAEASVAEHGDPAWIHDHGRYRLKNIHEPVHVYEVLWAADSIPGVLRGERVDAENDDDPGQ